MPRPSSTRVTPSSTEAACPQRIVGRLAGLRALLDAPVDALPLDALRVAVGALAMAYFARLAWQAGDFVASTGFYDHALIRELYWFTAQPVFQVWMGATSVRLIYGVAVACSLALLVGYRPRASAALAYVVAVCSYRHGFLVVSVDDALVHLLLGWMVLLPVGRTLGPRCFVAPPRAALRQGCRVRVPGLTTRLFLSNVALLYLVAGLTKWQSPLWREGHALLAVLKLPASFSPELWSEAHSWFLRPLNWAAMALEPLFALMIVLPPRSRVKLALGAAVLAFHLLICLALDVALANLGCIAAALVIFRVELMDRVRRWTVESELDVARDRAPRERTPLAPALLAGVVVGLLYGAMLGSALQPSWRGRDALGAEDPQTEGGGPIQRACVTGLWGLGLAQQYRLLDWIDERNYHVRLEVTESTGRGDRRLVPSTRYLPHTMRGGITLSYLIGGRWVPIPASREVELRASLQERVARRYCARSEEDAAVRVVAHVRRIDPLRLPTAAAHPHEVARFVCRAGDAFELEPNLRPARYED